MGDNARSSFKQRSVIARVIWGAFAPTLPLQGRDKEERALRRQRVRSCGMTRRATDSRSAAEMAFKAATTKPAEPIPSEPKPPSLPGAKELVSLRIDRDVLDFFQKDGPGWQERINDALRKAADK